jgi:hypothetical protein
MRRWISPVAATAFFAAGLLCVPVANAQEQSPSPAQPGAVQSIPDQKLDATAAAIERVTSLKEDYQQKMAAAPPSDRQRIADEAQDALVKAVTDQGLAVEEYTAILKVAQADAQVREKIMERLKPSSEK